MSHSPEDLSVDYDVVIIGAGISGLIAARELMKRVPDTRIIILEAKNRVGGRTLGIEMKGAKHSKEVFDIGGQWVGNTQNYILQILNELDLRTFEQYSRGTKVGQMGTSKPRTYSTDVPVHSIRQFSIFEIIDTVVAMAKIKWMTTRTQLLDYFAWKKATSLDDLSVSKWSRENCWTRANQDAIDIATRSIYGVDANRISMFYNLVVAKSAGGYMNLCECIGNGGQALKIAGGAFQIADRLAKEHSPDQIRLSHAVQKIDVDEQSGRAIIYGVDKKKNEEFSITCHHVISAIPPNQCGRIRWTPNLPNLKRRLFDGCMQGNLIKFVITYETPFWREKGYSGEVVSTGRTSVAGEVLPIICTFDGTSASGVPAIVGFMNEEYSDKPFTERCNAVVSDLVRFLGDDAFRQFLDYKDKVWAHEDYNGGCPSVYIPPGQMEAYQIIREPFYNVHFAGTESATQWIGYMDGAVQSGLRCAHEVIQSMEKFNLVSYNHLRGTIYDQEFKPPTPQSNIYNETRSPWWRRMFFMSMLVFGVYAYSRHYQLTFFERTMKPMENKMLRFFFDVEFPV